VIQWTSGPIVAAVEKGQQSMMIPQVTGVDLTAFVDAVADRVANKVLAEIRLMAPAAEETLLLTVQQVARKLGRTVAAVEHLIRENKLPVVRIDRRVFVDYRDILSLIERHKTLPDI
jgi:hypothetical protein